MSECSPPFWFVGYACAYRFFAFFNVTSVGEGLAPPDKSVQNKREDNILPYNQNIEIRTHFVGTVRPYLLCKLTVLKIGRALGKPQVFFENIVHAPTGLIVFQKLMPVGEHSICSRKGTGGYGIRPYGFNGCPKIRL